MSSYVKTLVDKDNNQILPRTVVGAVTDFGATIDGIKSTLGHKVVVTQSGMNITVNLVNDSNTTISSDTFNVGVSSQVSNAVYDGTSTPKKVTLTFGVSPDDVSVDIPIDDITGGLASDQITINGHKLEDGSFDLNSTEIGHQITADAWATSTEYAIGDLVNVTADGETKTYKCAQVHTSGTFATDLAAGDWVLYSVADELNVLSAEKGHDTNVAAEWVAGHSYAIGDYVLYEGTLYKCIVANEDYTFITPTKWTATSLGTNVTMLSNQKAEQSTIAYVYDSTKTYSVGDIVAYEGLCYECTVAIDIAESFDVSKWKLSSSLKSDINDLKSALQDYVAKDGVGEVTPQNLQIVDATISKNLYNAETVSPGFMLKNGNVEPGNYTHTDFIPVIAGETYFFSLYMNDSRLAMSVHNVCCFDNNKEVMPNAGTDVAFEGAYVVPAGVAFIRSSNYVASSYSKWQIEKNSVMTDYEPFGLLNAVIKEEYIPPVNLNDIPAFELVQGQNLWNQNDPDLEVGFLTVDGKVDHNNTSYLTSGFIPVTEGDNLIASYKTLTGTSGATIRSIAAYDINKTAINAKGAYTQSRYIVPAGISFVRISINSSSYGSNLQVQNLPSDQSFYPYTPYNNPHYELKHEYMFDMPEAPINVFLPKDIYVAVGRTIELYNSQIVLDYEKYHFNWTCYNGTARKRKFSITGETVGNLELRLTLYDDKQRICWSGTSTIHVVAASNPVRKIMPIGDSLTNWKAWLQETMLLSSNSITWIGTRYSGQSVDSEGNIYPSGEIHSEGRSGWSATSYLTNSTYTFDDRYDGVASVQGSANPFWDGTKFSLTHYLSVQTSVPTPDAVQVFLGTNDLTIGVEDAINKITNLVTLIRNEYPTMPIFVCNTIYRSNQDGYGSTGADAYTGGGGAGAWQYGSDVTVMKLAKGLTNAFADDTNIHFIPLISCMDREYDFGQVMTKVNPRSTVEVPMPSESVHPEAPGYYQMADLMYSFYCGILS